MFKDKIKSFVDKFQSNDDFESSYEYDDVNDDFEMERETEPLFTSKNSTSMNFEEKKQKKDSFDFSNTSSIDDYRINRQSNYNTTLYVIKPKKVDDWKTVGDNLRRNNIVIINFEGVPSEVPQRVTDSICGIAYALDAVARYVNQNILIVVPSNVELTGDVQKDISNKIQEVSSNMNSFSSYTDIDNIDSLYNK